MKKSLKISVLAITLLLIFSLLTTACGSTKEKTQETPKTQDSTTSIKTTEEPITGDPVKLKIFITNGGWTLKDVDFNNNPWIEFINKKANVILDVNCPPQTDAQTKFNLLITSGDLPDVFSCFANSFRKPYDGALKALDEYIKNSPVLSNFHDKDVYEEAMTEKDGHIYLIRSNALESKNPVTWNARGDIIEEVYGKVPETLDEWIECAKAEKAKYPEYVPFSSFGVHYLTHFFQSFGVDFTWGPFRLINGKVTNIWTLPQMKEALEFYKKLYNDGLLDKTFATNKVEDWVDRYENKGLLVWNGAMYASQPNTAYYYGKGKNMFFINVPTAVAPGVDPKLCYRPVNRVGNYEMGISSKCKNSDAAARVIEAFCSPEFKEFITYGREGIEYTVKDGKKEIIPDKYNETHVFKSLFRFMWDFHTTESAENTIVSYGIQNFKDNRELYKKYLDSWKKDKEIGFKQAEIAGYDPFEFYKRGPAASAILAKTAELPNSLAIKYITSNISIEEFDKQVEQYVKELEPVAAEMQAYYDEHN